MRTDRHRPGCGSRSRDAAPAPRGRASTRRRGCRRQCVGRRRAREGRREARHAEAEAVCAGQPAGAGTPATGAGTGTPAHSPTGRESRCARTWPAPSTACRRRPRTAAGADDQLRLPLRRRAGGLFAADPDPTLGRSAGHVASPLRDGARPRSSRRRLRLARGERSALRVHAALRLRITSLFHKGHAQRLRRWPDRVCGRGQQ